MCLKLSVRCLELEEQGHNTVLIRVYGCGIWTPPKPFKSQKPRREQTRRGAEKGGTNT